MRGRRTARVASAAARIPRSSVIPAFGLPAVNTAILLTSSVTVTIAHHALREGKRGMLKLFLAATFLLGFLFVVPAGRRSITRPTRSSACKLSTGIYGSTFFMLTGFHGLHVTIGAIMLTIIWLRVMKGHFTPAAPLRVRSGGLVLALRRRGVAGPVYLRLLDLSEEPLAGG